MDWPVQVMGHINIPERTMDWLMQVVDHINILEH